MRATFGTLLPIIGTSPERMVNRLPRPLDHGLTYEGGTLPTPMDPGFVAAALGHRGDARVPLYFLSTCIAITVFAEACQQPVPGQRQVVA